MYINTLSKNKTIASIVCAILFETCYCLFPLNLIAAVENTDVQAVDFGSKIYPNITIKSFNKKTGLYDYPSLPFETYIKLVVAQEMGNHPNRLEAYKAQAVAARSFANFWRNKYGNNSGYALTNTTDDQAFSYPFPDPDNPLSEISNTVIKACDDTAGEAIAWKTNIIAAQYGESSNGHTLDSEASNWESYTPYLRSVPSLGDTTSAGNGIGLSQNGAWSYAGTSDYRNDYVWILEHYYSLKAPIVKRVAISQDDVAYYEGYWTDNESGGEITGRTYTIKIQNPISGQSDVAIEIDFSEPMKSNPSCYIKDNTGSNLTIPLTAVSGTNQKKYAGTISKNTLASGKYDGQKTLYITGTDQAGNSIDGKPKTFATWSDSEWDNYEDSLGNDHNGGEDTQTSFAVYTLDKTPPEITVIDNGGEVKAGETSDGADGVWISVDDFGPEYGPLYGSGLARLEIYKGDPAAGGKLIASNTDSFDAGTVYSSYDSGLDWLADLPVGLITVKAFDRAGNVSTSSFTIRPSPHVSLMATHSGQLVYSDVWGERTSPTSTLMRDFNLYPSYTNSGIASVKITGPGDSSYNPTVTSNAVQFSLLPGDYNILVADGQGNKTTLPINIGEMNVYVSTQESVGNIHYSSDYYAPGTADATLKFNFNTSNGLDRVEFLNADGSILQTDTLSGTSASVSISPDLLNFSWVGINGVLSDISARAYDIHNNFITDKLDIRFNGSAFGVSIPAVYPGSGVGPILDLSGSELNIIPNGAFVSNYFVGQDTSGVLSAIVDNSLGITGTVTTLSPPAEDSVPNYDVANVTLKFRTGNNPNLSDASDMVLTSGMVAFSGLIGEIPNFTYSYTSLNDPSRLALKRYGRIVADVAWIAPDGRVCPSQTECYKVSSINLGRPVYYSAISLNQGYQEYEAVVTKPGVAASLGDNVTVQFSAVNSPDTNLRLSMMGYYPPLGSITIPRNTAYSFQSSPFSGSAKISFKVDTLGLTPGQAAALKILRVGGSPGQYTELPTTLSAGTVSADVTALGEFMVTAPVYATPHSVASAELVNGAPQLELISNSSAVTYAKIHNGSIFSDQMVGATKNINQLPAGDIYLLEPDNFAFDIAATIKMRYDKTLVSATGLIPAIYEMSVDGRYASRIPSMNWDMDKGEITALVPRLHSLFVVMVSSRQLAGGDKTAPSTTINYISTQVFSAGNVVYISSGTKIYFTATDLPFGGAPKATYYFKDVLPDLGCLNTSIDTSKSSGTCANPVYQSPFSMDEGTHTISYFSVDNVGNFEAKRSARVYVDGSAPQTTLFAGGVEVEDSSTAFISNSASITIIAVDQVSNGVVSNVKEVYRFIDVSPASCGQMFPVVSTAPAGSCKNYLYTGAFGLAVGTHTVYYSAIDNAGNLSTGKSAQISVIGSVNSSNLVGGTPEIRFVTPIANASITPVASGSAQGLAALAQADSQDLLRVSSLYKLSPDGDYPAPTSVTFTYSPAALPSGVPEAELAVFERSGAAGWVKLSSQTADAASHLITAPVSSLASSLFAILGPKPAVSPVASAFSGVTETGITARWSSNGNPSDASYVAHISTDSGFGFVLLSSETANLSAQFGAGGAGSDLAANTTYYFRVKSVGRFNSSDFVALGSTWTLAFPPSGTVPVGVWITSAAISWELNNNPAGTLAEVQRSTENGAYARMFLSAAVSATDANLKACTTYYYKVRNRNWAGIYSGFDSSTHFTTMGSTPSTAGDFTAESLSGNRIGLSWGFSPSEGVTQYLLYSDAGTGTIDYDTPLAVFGSTVTSWTTGALTSATSYKFGLRTKNRCGIEETNTSVFASATALTSLTGVRAAIKVPQTGKHIQGNSITVVAELLTGDPAQTNQVLFQYRLLGTTSWTDITAANVNHPNPDLDSPYLVHWDVTSFTPGVYELRAAATDISNTIDAAPPTITVVVDQFDFDINENATGGQGEKDQKVDNAVTNTVQAADEGSSLLVKLVLPAGALDTSTVTITVLNAPAVRPSAPQGAEDLGVVTRITLSNSQSLLSGGQTATLTLNYKDDDDNGIVDGTSVKADSLKMYAAATSAGPWVLLPSVVDKVKKTVTGTTPHFSFFGVFASAAADLSKVRVYPNPYKPNGVNADEGAPYSAGNPNSGIIFDNLTDRVTIKIYTLTGQLVAKVSSDGSGGKIQWDAKNDSGHDVASGGYVAVITSPGHNDTVKKILIVR